MSFKLQVRGAGPILPEDFVTDLLDHDVSTRPGTFAEEESDYEEISEQGLKNQPSYCNSVMANKTGIKSCCALCGNPNPVILCDPCGNKLFCGSCNEMYHRHPKRHNHVRKLLKVLENRPPIPPKPTSAVPVPPPRRNRGMQSQILKRFPVPVIGAGIRSAISSPSINRTFSFDPFGSLKRFVTSGKSSPVSQHLAHRFSNSSEPSHEWTIERRPSEPYPQNNVVRSQLHQRSFSVTNQFLPNTEIRNVGFGQPKPTIPTTVLELGRRSGSTLLQEKSYLPSRENSEASCSKEIGFVPFAKQSGNKWNCSTSSLHRFPRCATINPVSHLATLQRRTQQDKFCPASANQTPFSQSPPQIPPRDFTTQRQLQSPRQMGMQGSMRRAVSLSGEDLFLRKGRVDSPKQVIMDKVSHPFFQPSYAKKQYPATITPGINRPLPPVPQQKSLSAEHEYYSGDVSEEEDWDQKNNLLSSDPTGPWNCEHCTFINPTSTRVCTVCCKTPSVGYKMVKGYKNSPNAHLSSKLSVLNPEKENHKNLVLEQNPIGEMVIDKLSGSSSSCISSEENEEVKLIQAQAKSNHKFKKVTGKRNKTSNKVFKDSSTGDYSVMEISSPKHQPSKIISPLLSNLRTISTGTSPPPQEISTQTYEMIPMSPLQISSDYKVSTQSLTTSTSISRGVSPPPPFKIEMSQKAIRLARRAQQQSKLKRSASTHLPSYSNHGSISSGPWSDFPSDSIKYSTEISHNKGRSHHRNSEGPDLYRSSSRHSLASDTRSLPLSGQTSRDSSPPIRNRDRDYLDDYNLFSLGNPNWDTRFPPSPGEYFASIEDLVMKRVHRAQESELSRLLREAEENGFTPEDLQVAFKMCGEKNNPIKWLEENWSNMIETVQTLGTKFGRDKGKECNEVGTISVPEAKEALRLHKGNVWAAVTQVVESRQIKFNELKARGSFPREDILTALTANQGNLDAAYVELSKNQLKPFLMRIWGPPTGQENESTPPQVESTYSNELAFSSSTNDATQEALKTKDLVSTCSLIENPDISIGRSQQHKTEPVPLLPDAMEEPDSEESISNFIQNFGISSPVKTSTTKKSKAAQVVSNHDETKVLRSESIATIATAVRIITDKLGAILLAQDQITQIKSHNQDSKSLQTVSDISPTTSTINSSLENSDPHQSNETEASVSILDLPNSEESKGNEFQIYESKSKSSKIYERIGHFASSFFKSTKPTYTMEKTASKSLRCQILEKSLEKLNCGIPVTIVENSNPIPLNPYPESVEYNPNNITSQISCIENSCGSTNESGFVKNTIGTLTERSCTSKLQNIKNISESISNVIQFQENNILLNENDGNEEYYDSEEDADSSTSYSSSFTDTKLPNPVLIGQEINNHLKEDEECLSIESELSGSEKNLSEIPSSSEESDAGIHEEINLNQKPLEHQFFPFASTNASRIKSDETEQQKTQQVQVPNAQKLLLDGKVDTEEKGEIVSKLMEMNFSEDESLGAANECSSLYSAISFLQQECNLCAGRYSAKQMVSMLRCTHMCCRYCASDYFKIQIRDRSILEATCPYCKEPMALEDTDSGVGTTETLDYFSHLDILLKGLLDDHVYELFVRKLRDWTLSRLPNFKWCSKCSSGFITEPLQTHLICPDCNAVTCAICLEPWDKLNHSHIKDHLDRKLFCDEIAPSNTETVVSKPNSQFIIEYLNQNCIECPKCRSKFSLARGGCMHLTCTNCHYEFCSGCSSPFAMGPKCKNGQGSSALCGKLGLHAHHPRNCLFYLRDKEPELLEKLLTEFNVEFMRADNTEQRTSVKSKKCQVSIQRETQDGMEDGLCDQLAMNTLPLICKSHYVEYLGLEVWAHNLDPVAILSNDDLETIVKRSNKKMPSRPYGIKEEEYRIKLLDLIHLEIPIEPRKK